MSERAEKLMAQAMTLPPDERKVVGYCLLESLESSDNDNGLLLGPNDAMREELDRRCAASDANPEDVVTWDQIEAHVRRSR
jgi:putative addiction module component (TIGR02574 family)